MDIISFGIGVVTGVVIAIILLGGFIYWKLKKLGVLQMIKTVKGIGNIGNMFGGVE